MTDYAVSEDQRERAVESTDFARAIINLLNDSVEEKSRLENTYRAVVNLLSDFRDETARLGDAQRALLNIIDDFDTERRTNRALAREVEQRTRAEAALRQAKAATDEANRELEAFSYSVAHDLRAPLRSIDGFGQALVEDCAEQISVDGKRYLAFVRESAQQMARLIDDLLALSRISRSELHREPVDLVRLAREAIRRLRHGQPDRRVDFVAPAHAPARADVHLLEVVLANLLGNAWKFTSKRAQARIEFGRRAEPGHVVYFVRDDGVGFDMAYAKKLFGAFQRLHAASEFEGSGIGLATVQRIIHRHGGRVWAEGVEGVGATLYFTLGKDS